MMKPPRKFELNFVLAGYSRRFDATVDESVPTDHPAFTIFQQFDGLHIHSNQGTGVECETSDIAFQPIEGVPQFVSDWEKRLDTKLIGVAIVFNGSGQVWVSDTNDFYLTRDSNDGFGWLGNTFERLVECLLEGHRDSPMFKPDEEKRIIAGGTVKKDDPRVHSWS
ncbi:MAG: SUKH-3 domain-containing protein [Planctomycetota bacterium]